MRMIMILAAMAVAITALALAIAVKVQSIQTINSLTPLNQNFDLIAGDGMIVSPGANGHSLKFNVTIVGGGNISVTTLPNGTIFLEWIGSSEAGGTVTSVDLATPTDLFQVTSAPVTLSGTLAFATKVQNANAVWIGPSTGLPAVPTFRHLVLGDLPLPVLTNGQLYIGSTGNTPVAATLVRHFLHLIADLTQIRRALSIK